MTNTTHPSTPALVLHKCDHCEAHFLLAPGGVRACQFCDDETLKPRTINPFYLHRLVGWCYCTACGTVCNLPHRHNTTCMYCGMGSLILITPETLLRIIINPTPQTGGQPVPFPWLP